MKEKLRNRPEIFLVPFVFIFVMWLWETLINRLEIKETILPTPSRIGEALVMQFQNAYFWQNASEQNSNFTRGYCQS